MTTLVVKNKRGFMLPLFLFFLTCFLIQVTCTFQPSNKLIDSESQIKGEMSFELDSNQTYTPRTIRPVISNTDSYLAILNNSNLTKLSIAAYDLNSGVKKYEYHLDSEGSNGVGNPRNFYMEDEYYFIISSYSYSIFKMEADSIEHAYRLLSDSLEFDPLGGLVMSGTTNPCHVYDSVLYCPMIPDNNPFEKEYYRHNILLGLDIETGSTKHSYSYPKIYDDYRLLETSIYSNTFNDSLAIFSFPILDSIYVLNLNSGMVESKYAGSLLRYGDPITNDFSKIGTNLEARMEFLLNSRLYKYIYYDRYKKSIIVLLATLRVRNQNLQKMPKIVYQ